MQLYDLTIHFTDGSYKDVEKYANDEQEAKRKAIYYEDYDKVSVVCFNGIIELE
jgi:hypothetical protein